MAVDVRWATTEDAAALATILCEMAAHYRQAQLDPHFALAFAGGEVAGLASVAIAHPGIDLERLMFLKDLFVREGARNQGAGRALIAFLAGHCLSHGIGRIDLTTEDWNDGARRFYTQLGAERHGQKIFLRLSGEALKTAAKS
ncbi:MAG: GNAT family N-acetyltransferase [Mesorhizobium sp.]|uniref:GNAT family N-acetyltransferase n=1 Tax=Mesorhizobium sp. TaxID=1871066 RepID=UPI000FE4F10B|nr:GNAT family N-acetyltransferase [Mesorhizobium sp.]RWF39859.1 MAG: GNAT family N-acetyltransferase [Mesorhizobium sp.]